ncbi:MAG: dienelactone hydrolase family protein [Betaproteobacteria bacterium]|nr:dienelactone hydrolase family protein [Betaproteobacteria bacterium]
MNNARWVEIDSPDGGTFGAYLSLPPAGKGPGIVLVQEIFGVNEHIRAVADQFALDGFVVLAPDVFWRQQPRVELGYDEAGFVRGRALKSGLDFGQAVRDLSAAASVLRGRPELAGKVASIGYCMGGLLSYLFAASGRVDAAVCYYGAGIDAHLDQAEHIKCPMLFHVGEQDALISPAAVKAVSKAFAPKADAWVQTYPGVDHGFNCWARRMFNQAAAALARGRTLEFLSIYL